MAPLVEDRDVVRGLKNLKWAVVVVGIGMVLAAVPVATHHSFAAEFDGKQADHAEGNDHRHVVVKSAWTPVHRRERSRRQGGELGNRIRCPGRPMNQMSVVTLIAALALGVSAPARTQGKPNFSGTWIYNQALSSGGTSGNNPLVSFPSELLIKQTPVELHWQSSSIRQDAITAIFKLDGSEVTMAGRPEITMKGKAMLEGDKLVISSRRSYSSPAGDITTDFKEVYTVAGDVLTIEKTQTTGGVSSTLQAVYNKTTS
jgi:hypothetical protein